MDITRIKEGRPVIRRTAAFCSHFPLVVELHPRHLHLRIEGHPDGYDLSYEVAFRLAARRAKPSRLRREYLSTGLRRSA